MRWLARLEEILVASLLAGMTLVTFMQVVARYVFNYSFVWAMELTGVLFAWLIFVGMSYGARIGAHIGIDALTRQLSARAGRIVGIVAAASCLIYSLIMLFGSWQYVSRIYEIGILMQDMPVPTWVPRVVLPVGFGLLALRFAEILVRMLRGEPVRLLGDEVEEALAMEREMKQELAHEAGPADEGPRS